LIVGRSTIRVPGQIKLERNIVDTSKTKPDLMGASPASAGSGRRILAHLEHGAKPATKPGRARTAGWTIDGWTVGVVFLLIFIVSVAWLVREETIPQPSAFKHDSGKMRTPVATTRQEELQRDASPAELAKKSAGVDGQVATTGQTGQAAAIINEAGPSQKMPAPSRASASAASPMLANAEQPRIVTPAARKQNGATGTNESAARTAAAAAASAARTHGDTDVALLTALVAHANKPSVVVPERSRDIVQRQEGDTTVQLLARCKQLGLIEGMLCRSRICSGRWEADAACRAPAH
jgi:hypothetical protein